MTAPLTALWLRIDVRSGRLFPPLAVAAALLALVHSGGASPARPTYATAAALLFPIQVWLARQAVSAVPGETRRVILVAVSSRLRLFAGVLLAASIPLAALAAISLVWPWLAGAIPVNGSAGADVAFGVGATLVLLPPAAVLGVLTSEVSVRDRGQSAMVGAAAVTVSLLIGFSPALAWLAPPLVGLARLGGSTSATAGHLVTVAAHSCAWSVAVGVLTHRRLRSLW